MVGGINGIRPTHVGPFMCGLAIDGTVVSVSAGGVDILSCIGI